MVELLLLAAALSADNFAVSIGYGSSNTRISPGMTALLNLFCSAALVASAQFGKRFLQSAGFLSEIQTKTLYQIMLCK